MTAAPEHWAIPYIGLPWDPVVHHCWGLCRKVWREQFGWMVPEVEIDGASPYAARKALAGGYNGWIRVETPVEGDAVLMALGLHPCHVGIWIAPAPEASVLHSVEGAGTIFNTRSRLLYRIENSYRWSN